MHIRIIISVVLLNSLAWQYVQVCPASANEQSIPNFTEDIVPIFTKYCVGCHNFVDREGELSLESFGDLQEGSAHGPVILPEQPESSRLVRVLIGLEALAMPPEDYEAPTEKEIELLKVWIGGGAKGPAGVEPLQRQLKVPSIEPQIVEEAAPVTAISLSPDGSQIAVARFARLDMYDKLSGDILFTLRGLPGKVNAVHFSSQGEKFVIATGVGGLSGQALIYDSATGDQLNSISGHRDVLNDAEMSPDGALLATASHDKQIMLWNLSDGELLHNLSGHNGAIFDIAFRLDGNVLASASADETIKLWNVTTGARLDTLSQPEAEQYVLSFSPDGKYLVAGGADSRIRVWRADTAEAPQDSQLLYTRFAHEGSVNALCFSADGSTLITAGSDHFIKFWETRHFADCKLLSPRSAHINDLCTAGKEPDLVVGQADGGWHLLKVEKVDSRDIPTPNVASRNSSVSQVAETSFGLLEEDEPNNSPQQAIQMTSPGRAKGVIHSESVEQTKDIDMYRFFARAGQSWILEIKAACVDSPLDSKLEVLTKEGKRIERVLLQAVRDSYLKYSGRDSETFDDFRLHNWEEMEINEYVYLNGEVMKLWHYPRGVDSGYMVYPGVGKRHSYFGTTPITHALNETAYTVVPYSPGSKLVPSSLPVFPIYFENDDDGERDLGTDSRLLFVAPADGEYIAAVSDIRGFGGEAFTYELTVRPPKPDCQAKVILENTTIDPGTGREFQVTLVRIDGFQEEVRIDIQGLPSGFSASTPIVVQRGQTHAFGTINAQIDAPQPPEEVAREICITCSAMIDGELRVKEVPSFATLSLGKEPEVTVEILPANLKLATGSEAGNVHGAGEPLEIAINPGETISAIVRIIRRDGFDEEVSLGKNMVGRNLPHGVYVDNVGLNGLLINKGSNQREFFITAAKWVPQTSRQFHLKAELKAENYASRPVLLKVLKLP